MWQDRRQAFDPVIAGVQEQIYQGAYQFDEVSPAWYPQVLLANGSGMYETPAVLLRVKPDGTSRLVMAVNAVAESKLNLRRCPFDGQRLEAVFAVFGFDVGEVVLEAEPIGGLALAILASLLAGLYPAYKMASAVPASAMRGE